MFVARTALGGDKSSPGDGSIAIVAVLISCCSLLVAGVGAFIKANVGWVGVGVDGEQTKREPSPVSNRGCLLACPSLSLLARHSNVDDIVLAKISSKR